MQTKGSYCHKSWPGAPRQQKVWGPDPFCCHTLELLAIGAVAASATIPGTESTASSREPPLIHSCWDRHGPARHLGMATTHFPPLFVSNAEMRSSTHLVRLESLFCPQCPILQLIYWNPNGAISSSPDSLGTSLFSLLVDSDSDGTPSLPPLGIAYAHVWVCLCPCCAGGGCWFLFSCWPSRDWHHQVQHPEPDNRSIICGIKLACKSEL